MSQDPRALSPASRGDAQQDPGRLYSAYGLLISSEIPLPDLPHIDGSKADVSISFTELHWRSPDPDSRISFEEKKEGFYVSWRGFCSFLISADSVRIQRVPGVTDDAIRLCLFGPVMALLLHIRGLLVLHGSVVAVAGRPVILLGDKGAGKSTTAAAFHRWGYKILSDDLAVIRCDPSGALLFAGVPQLRLLPEAASVLSFEALTRTTIDVPDFPKEIHRLGATEQSEWSRPIVCVLGRSDELSLEPLSDKDGFLATLRFSYIHLFPPEMHKRIDPSLHLRQCGLLARQARFLGLGLPHGVGNLFDSVGALVRLLESGD